MSLSSPVVDRQTVVGEVAQVAPAATRRVALPEDVVLGVASFLGHSDLGRLGATNKLNQRLCQQAALALPYSRQQELQLKVAGLRAHTRGLGQTGSCDLAIPDPINAWCRQGHLFSFSQFKPAGFDAAILHTRFPFGFLINSQKAWPTQYEKFVRLEDDFFRTEMFVDQAYRHDDFFNSLIHNLIDRFCQVSPAGKHVVWGGRLLANGETTYFSLLTSLDNSRKYACLRVSPSKFFFSPDDAMMALQGQDGRICVAPTPVVYGAEAPRPEEARLGAGLSHEWLIAHVTDWQRGYQNVQKMFLSNDGQFLGVTAHLAQAHGGQLFHARDTKGFFFKRDISSVEGWQYLCAVPRIEQGWFLDHSSKFLCTVAGPARSDPAEVVVLDVLHDGEGIPLPGRFADYRPETNQLLITNRKAGERIKTAELLKFDRGAVASRDVVGQDVTDFLKKNHRGFSLNHRFVAGTEEILMTEALPSAEYAGHINYVFVVNGKDLTAPARTVYNAGAEHKLYDFEVGFQNFEKYGVVQGGKALLALEIERLNVADPNGGMFLPGETSWGEQLPEEHRFSARIHRLEPLVSDARIS